MVRYPTEGSSWPWCSSAVSLREVVVVCSIYSFELNLIMKFGQSRCWNFFCLSSSKLPWNLCYLNYPRCSGDCDSWIMFIMHWTSKQSNFGTTRTGIHLHLHLRQYLLCVRLGNLFSFFFLLEVTLYRIFMESYQVLIMKKKKTDW